MNPKSVLLAVTSLLIFAACGGGSSLPEPTGKADIRAINAIERSPAISFRIEELTLANIEYRQNSVTSSYDDFVYNLNFDVVIAGDNQATRIASTSIDTQAGQDYTLLLSGTIAAPTVTVWESAIRTFDTGASVFQTRFAHTASSVGAVDYYLAAEGVVPVLGEAVASSLNFADITAPADFESGDYVLTITTAGDPLDILYTSDPLNFPAQRILIITPFDGDASNTAPIIVRALGAFASTFTLPDSDYPSTIEFLHASPDLGISDIYEDEALTIQLAQNHDYQQLTAPIPVPVSEEEHTYRYTPAGDTASVTLEATLSIVPGFKVRSIAAGLAGAYTTPFSVPDRRPIDTAGKVSVYHTSNNFAFINFYLAERDEPLDTQAPFRAGIAYAFPTDTAFIVPGSYDLYAREFGATEILAGPIPLDIALGDVYEVLAFDNVADPAVLDLQLNDLLQ
jgi:hypothetical protein